MDSEPTQHRASDTTLEFVIIVGFFLVMVAMFFWQVPRGNKTAFDQMIGALILVFGLVAKSLWDRRGQGAVFAEKAIESAQQQIPASAMPLMLPAPTATKDAVAAGTEKGVKDAVADLTAPDPTAAVHAAIKDAIENGVLDTSADRPTEIIE